MQEEKLEYRNVHKRGIKRVAEDWFAYFVLFN
jgi:hypothetical protein